MSEIETDENYYKRLINAKNNTIYLSEEDYNIFIESINNPPEPNDKLKEATSEYKRLKNEKTD